MHQNVITADQFVDIQSKLQVFGCGNAGDVATTIGKHPSLGSCVLFGHATRESVLLSELPFDGRADSDTGSASEEHSAPDHDAGPVRRSAVA